MKRSGPRIEPCGKPNLTWNSFDVDSDEVGSV